MSSISEAIKQVDLFIGEEELRILESCILERWLTEGPRARAFNQAIRKETGANYAFFAPNGTLGLFLSLLALDLDPGSEIIIPSFTFYGTATAAVFAGLKPIFIDVDPKTFNATAEAYAAAITPRTRALMPVHIYGQCSDMPAIIRVARADRLKVVEDAAQAFGVTLNGQHAGTFGDIGVFSFFSDKAITTGEGGALITNDAEIADRIALIRNQGRSQSGTFIHPGLGMNFRITDLQAAIGLTQIAKLPQIKEERIRKWRLYQEGLAGVGDLEFVSVLAGSTLVPFRFPILSGHKAALQKELESQGIETRSFFHPMHLQPKLIGLSPPQSLPVSESLCARGLCLPIHHHLSEAQVSRVIDAIRAYFRA